MESKLKILFVEDLPTDVELAKRTLTKEGIKFQSRVVENENDFIHELEKFVPDIIISDYKMPAFDGMRALNLAIEKCPNTPFILLTGSVNEEIAVECIKAGATDYVIKEHITRLPFAVREAIEQEKKLLEKLQTEKLLHEKEQTLSSHINNSPLAMVEWDSNFIVTLWAGEAEKVFGYSPAETIGKQIMDFNLIYDEDIPIVQKVMERLTDGKTSHVVSSNRNVTKSGKVIFCEWYNSALLNKKGQMLSVMSQVLDITERKLAEEELKHSNLENIQLLREMRESRDAVLNMMEDAVEARYTLEITNKKLVEEITERKRNEVAFRESEDRYRDLVENSSDLICTHDLDGNILSANNAAMKITGYSLEELLKMNLQNLLVPEYQMSFKSYLAKIKTVGSANGLMTIQTKTGERRIWEYNNTLRTEGIAKPIVRGMVRDITERKHAEKILRETQEKIQKIFDSSPDAIWMIDLNGMVLECNQTTVNMHGYSTKEELVGKSGYNFVVESERQHAMELMQELLTERTIHGIELTMLRKDETTFLTESACSVLQNSSGDIFGIVVITKDITERKRAEEEIISQKNRFEQLFENSPIAIALLDDHDKVVQINESFSNLFGYFLEEIKGQSLNDIIVPTELKEEANSFTVQTLKGNYINKESYRMKKDSTLIYVQYVGVPVIINDKTVSSYALYVDLTQRKDSEDRMKVAKELAEQSDKLKSEFLAQMSHEIRTPINAIIGNVDFLNDLFDESMDADTRECFDGIGLASKRIIRTVDLILNAAELQTSGYKPYKVKVDLNSEILNKLYKEHQLLAKQKGLELIYTCESKDTKVLADVYSVTQIFANLMDNAIKYTKKGKVEVLLTKNKNGNVVIEVRDTGIGMSKEFLPRIFDPFVQEEHGFTRSYDGNGLGLTLVKNYCDINNAVIEVESEKNVGSTFRVIFK